MVQFNPLMLPPGCSRFDAYRDAMEIGPVHQQGVFPVWHILGHEECSQVLKDSEVYSSNPLRSFLIAGAPDHRDERIKRLVPVMGQTAEFVDNLMLMNDPPRHTRLRGLVTKAFSPTTVRRLQDRIQAMTDELIDEILKKKDTFDFVEDFAVPLPVHVVAEILGVDTERRHDFKRWSDGFVSVPIQKIMSGDIGDTSAGWREEFTNYFLEVFARRRKEPGDDLVSQLVSLEQQGEKISSDELLATCVLLMVAGNETTTNLLSNTALALTQFPDEMDYLLKRPAAIPEAIEESLRFIAPIQGFPRYCTTRVQLGGKTLKPGDMLMVWAGAANRDEKVFADPDRFDITRPPGKHLSFGMGIHHCLGATLARVEGQIAFETFFRKIGRLQPVDGEAPEFLPSAFLFGLKHFWLSRA